MDLIAILSKTISPDRSELEAAQRYLEQAAANNFVSILFFIVVYLLFSNALI